MTVLFNRKINRRNSYQLGKRKEGQIIPLISDVMFHTMLNNEARKKYVCYFLSLVLEKEMAELEAGLEFVKQEIDQENVHDARKTVDLVCKFGDEIWNIEMNNATTVTQLERNISYLMDLYKSKMKSGSKYQYQKTIQININNFTFEGNHHTMEKFYLMNEEKIILTDKVQIIYFYLPNIKEKYYNKSKLSEVEKLLLIFNEEDSKELEKMMEGNKIMEAYRTDAKEASKDEEIIGLYDKEFVDEMIRYNELKEAKEEGIDIGTKEIAKNLLLMNISIENIKKATGLSTNEIGKLIDESC